MPVLSVLRKFPIKNVLCKPNQLFLESLQKRNYDPSKMFVTPSRWQWHKFKDIFHFYVMLGVIPLTALVFYVDIFIGPAQLAEIPEGYVPKEHEYHKHPISRWYMKHLYRGHQQEYETFIHWMFMENERREMTKIEDQVHRVMKARGDTKAYYYKPVSLKHIKTVRKEYDETREFLGEP